MCLTFSVGCEVVGRMFSGVARLVPLVKFLEVVSSFSLGEVYERCVVVR